MKQAILYVFTISLFIISINFSAKAFEIHGKIKDSHGTGIPFASVYIKGTSLGTSSNGEGDYILDIPKGKQFLTFSSIGYLVQTIELQIDEHSKHELNIELKEQGFGLKEALVKVVRHDRATEIMRQVIAKKRYFDQIVKGYSCMVYSKAVQRFLDAPKKLLGEDVHKELSRMGLDSGKRGIFYLSESVSSLNFKKPNSYSEEIISSKLSGNPRGFTFNQVSETLLDFTVNNIDLSSSGLTNKLYVSPLSDHAFAYYRFKLLSSTEDKNGKVDRIKVIPRNIYGRIFSGILYIQEPSYKILGLNLKIAKETGIDFIDSLNIKQNFIELAGDTSVLSSQLYSLTGGALGFKFTGSEVFTFSNYHLNPSWPDKLFKGQEVLIQSQANKKDSSYWNKIRPIPLTSEEQRDYQKKDSIYVNHKTKRYLDSIDRVDNKLKFGNILLNGVVIHHRFEKIRWDIQPIISLITYNSVEGIALAPDLKYTKRTSDSTGFSLEPQIRYGFSNHHFLANLRFNQVINFKKEQSYSLALGTRIQDFNNVTAINPSFNTWTTLLAENNILKLFEEHFLEAGFKSRLTPIVKFALGVHYSDRIPLVNTSFAHFYSPLGSYISANNPFGGTDNNPAFTAYKDLGFEINFDIHLGEKYVRRPEGIFTLESKYPKLNLVYRKGVPNFLNSIASYDYLEGTLHDENKSWGALGSFSYSLSGGGFINSASIPYTDAKAFNGKQYTFNPLINTPFLVINPYRFSSFSHYWEANIENNFEGLIFNKIPLLQSIGLQEILGASYLKSDQNPSYTEVYGGIARFQLHLSYGIALSPGNPTKHFITLTFGL